MMCWNPHWFRTALDKDRCFKYYIKYFLLVLRDHMVVRCSQHFPFRPFIIHLFVLFTLSLELRPNGSINLAAVFCYLSQDEYLFFSTDIPQYWIN